MALFAAPAQQTTAGFATPPRRRPLPATGDGEVKDATFLLMSGRAVPSLATTTRAARHELREALNGDIRLFDNRGAELKDTDNCTGTISVAVSQASRSLTPRRTVEELDSQRRSDRKRGSGLLMEPTFALVTGEQLDLGVDVETTRDARYALRMLTGVLDLTMLDRDGDVLGDRDSATGPITVVLGGPAIAPSLLNYHSSP